MKWLSWIPNAYFWFLWWRGFMDTDGNFQTPVDREKITYMLRRMKERSGIWWWVEYLFIKVCGSLTATIILAMLHRFGYAVIPAILFIFYSWLFLHILWPYTCPDEKFWEGNQ